MADTNVCAGGAGLLGLANFYRRFVKGFTVIAKLMTNLMRKDKDFTWGTEEEAAF